MISSARTFVLLTLAAATARAEGTVTLDEAVQLALRRQPQILQAEANTGIAAARAEQARAPLLPQLQGTATATRSRSTSLFGGIPVSAGGGVVPTGTTTGSANTFNQFTVGLTGSQTLWDFTAIQLLGAANRIVEAQRATARATAFQVVLDVRSAFFAVRARQALTVVARDNLENILQHQRQVQGFVKAGINPEIDLAQAMTDVANARVQWINARSAQRLAIAQLHQAMGVSQGPDSVADEEFLPVPSEDQAVDVLVAEAISNRPELESLVFQREAQALRIRAAWGAFMPTLGLTGGVSESGTRPNDLGLNWSFGAVLSWPLLQGGLTVGQIHEAQQTADSVLAQERIELLQVRLDVESAQLTLIAQKEVIGAAQEAIANAALRLKLAERRYEVGLGSIIELGDAQAAFTSARGQLVQARFDLATARARLIAALGRPP